MEDFSEYDDDSQVEKTIPTLLEDTYTSNEGLFASEEAASNQSADPAADFLARERQEMGDWSDELGFENSNINQINSAETVEVSELLPEEIRVTRTPSPQFFLDHPKPQVEPEKIRLWREDYAKQLQEKDEKENVEMQDLKNQAKKELSEWYKHYEEQLAKTKSSNRENETEFVSDATSVAPGTEWERVSKMCDFNPKSGKNAQDTSRMRSIMLQLKQHPPTKNVS